MPSVSNQKTHERMTTPIYSPLSHCAENHAGMRRQPAKRPRQPVGMLANAGIPEGSCSIQQLLLTRQVI